MRLTSSPLIITKYTPLDKLGKFNSSPDFPLLILKPGLDKYRDRVFVFNKRRV